MSSTTEDEISINSKPNNYDSRIATVDVNEPKKQNPNSFHLHEFPLFNLFFPKQDASMQDASKKKTVTVEKNAKEEWRRSPAIVKFPTTFRSFPSLKLEGDEYEKEEKSNPVVLWQVYIFGGFLIGKWLLSRWMERRPNSNPPPEDDPPEQNE